MICKFYCEWHFLYNSIVSLLDFLREIAEEAVQKWEDLSREKQKEVATELIPEIEQVILVLSILLSCPVILH